MARLGYYLTWWPARRAAAAAALGGALFGGGPAACAGARGAPARPPVSSGRAAPPAGAAPSFRQLVADAQRAVQAGDPAAVAGHLERADAIVPAHPTVLLYLARARLQTGDSVGAERTLARLASVGVGRPLADDSVLGRWLTATAARRALLARLAERAAPVIRSDTAVVLAAPDLIVESVALARTAGGPPRWVVGAMGPGAILGAAPDGALSTVHRAEHGGQPIGLKLDADGRLWANVRYPARPAAATGAAPAPDSAALLLIEAGRGAVLRRVPSPRDGRPHVFNDLAFGPTPRGPEVLLTDAEASRVYRLAPASDSLVPLPDPHGAFTAPNGIAVSPDGRRLYAAHLEGVTVWDRGTGAARRVAAPDGVPLTGIDGLYACRRGLVAVQALPDFTRVVWLRLGARGDRVAAAEVLEQRHPAHVQPTTGVLDGDTLYYVASSEVRRLRADGSVAPAAGRSATVVLRLPLGGRCRRAGGA